MKKFSFLPRLALLLALLLPGLAAHAAAYVDGARPDNSGDGLSWATAKKDVQESINLTLFTAAAGNEVWVKAGTYLPTRDPLGNLPTDPRDKAFYIRFNVKLYGGFAGTETAADQRNPAANLTTLSGDLDGPTGTADAYHVLLIFNSDPATISRACVVDGFTVEGGRANGSGTLRVDRTDISSGQGGGICVRNSSPTVSNCIFTNNTASQGGGIFSGNSTAVSNCTFTGNTASNGGGMYNGIGSTPTVSNCTFSGNTATTNGGGMYNSTSLASTVRNCTFSGNRTTGTAGFGGGLYYTGGGTLTNCILYQNTTANTADANREEIYKIGTIALTVSNCIVRDAAGTAPNLTVTNATLSNCYTTAPGYVDATDPAGPDNTWRTADDGLRLACGSFAVDLGAGSAPATDLLGNPRKGLPDLGAYEAVGGSTASNTIPAATTTVSGLQPAGPLAYTDCVNELLRLNAAAPYTLLGSTIATVYVQATAPTYTAQRYVRRSYAISPATNAGTATAEVTLYFTQADFTDYNANRGSLPALPTSAADPDGYAANLRISRFGTTNATGAPGAGQAPVFRALTAVSYNSPAARWEVRVAATGFGGFLAHTGPLPVLSSLSPASGPVGASVTLTGANLDGATQVTFSGTANNTVTGTPLTVSGTGSSQTITVTVPTGATTGNVTVTTPGGSSNGVAFTVEQDLTISSAQTIATGTYHDITITGPTTGGAGTATLGGAVAVTGTVTVQAGGTLLTNCQALTGGAGTRFVLVAGGTLGICDAAGISASGATGAVQTATRSFAADASYRYNGTLAQATGTGLPATVRNLTVDNAAGVTLTQPVTVAQVLTLAGAGNLRLNGQALLLRSDAAGTALVVNAGTGVVQGTTATLQRHIATNTAANGYRHYATPMQGKTVNTLATAGYVPDFTGAAAYNTSRTPGTVTPFPTVFGYDQSRIAASASNYSTFDKGWQAAVSGEAMPVGKGYAVQVPGAALVDFTGTPFTGPLAAQSLRRSTADPNTGWHLLGNPYPAPLDWSTMTLGTGQSLENVGGALYVFQSSGPYAGSYRTYLAAAPTGASPLVPAGAGFFVLASSPTTPGTVRFTNANRVTTFGAQPAFGRGTADPRPALTLTLAGPTGRDALTVYADPAATPGLDAALDAVKLPNPTGLNLAAQAGPHALAIDARPAFAAGTVVPLRVGVPAAGTYALQISALANLPAGATAVLVDTERNTRTDLATLPAAGYAFRVTAAQASAPLTTRFYLSLGTAVPLATAAGRPAPALRLFPNPATGATTLTGAAPGAAVTVLDALGRRVATATADATGTTALALPAGQPAGVYVVRAGTQVLRLAVE